MALICGGCSEQLDESAPAGALGAMLDAYEERNGAAIYGHVSAKTHEQIGEAFAGLRELRILIDQDVPLEARPNVVTSTALSELEGVADELALFTKLSRLNDLGVEKAVVYGGTVQTSEIDEAKGTARLSTLAGQIFEMTREGDGRWRSRHLEPVLEQRLRTLRTNLATLRSYSLALKERNAKVEQLLLTPVGTAANSGATATAPAAAVTPPGGAAPTGPAPTAKKPKAPAKKAKARPKHR